MRGERGRSCCFAVGRWKRRGWKVLNAGGTLTCQSRGEGGEEAEPWLRVGRWEEKEEVAIRSLAGAEVRGEGDSFDVRKWEEGNPSLRNGREKELSTGVFSRGVFSQNV